MKIKYHHKLNDFIENLSILLNLYKKNKDILFINLAFFLADYYFKEFKMKKFLKMIKFMKLKILYFDNLNKFLTYNLKSKFIN